jgi:AraC-like DNA-binding protein
MFGPFGAVVLTCTAPPHCGGRPSIETPHWSPVLPREHLRRLAPLLLEGGDDAQEATCDLLGLCLENGSPQTPDPWLRDVRRQLKEAPGSTRLTDLARQVGRHRVSVGRAFLAAYGEPPSVFRRRTMLDHALSLTATGTPPSWAAVEAGFVDQSHFIRACRDSYGMAPGRLLASAA